MLGRVRVGAGQQEHVVRHVGHGGPYLLAVDHVVVAVAHRAGLQRGQIGAGLRLGEPLAPHVLPGEDLGDELLLLLLGAVVDDGGPDDGHAQPAYEDVRRCPHAGSLLVVDELLHDGHAGAAVLLGPGRGHPVPLGQLGAPGEQVAHLLHDVDPAAPQLRRAFLLDEVVDFLSESLFFGSEAKVHHSLLSLGWSGSRRPACGSDDSHL